MLMMMVMMMVMMMSTKIMMILKTRKAKLLHGSQDTSKT